MIILIGGGLFLYQYDKDDEVILEAKKETKIEKKNIEKHSKEELISVDVKGEVNVPGMYSVKPNMRILDVIHEAGGLTDNADTTVINLSKKVVDEMVIVVYSRDQVQNFESTKKQEEYLQDKCRQPEENSIMNDACIGSSNQNVSDKININTATKEQLMTLTGIGESKANEIIAFRSQNGEFHSIEEIKNVPGIGDSIYAQIKESITV